MDVCESRLFIYLVTVLGTEMSFSQIQERLGKDLRQVGVQPAQPSPRQPSITATTSTTHNRAQTLPTLTLCLFYTYGRHVLISTSLSRPLSSDHNNSN